MKKPGMKVQVWNCGDENARMKIRKWKCGDENEGMKCGDENAGMKMLGMKNLGMKKPGDEVSLSRLNTREVLVQQRSKFVKIYVC